MLTPLHALERVALCLLMTGLAACSGERAEPPRAAGGESESVEAQGERLLERARELWEYKQRGDWIQVYAFLAPEYRRQTPLAEYIAGKEHHIYEDASAPLIIKFVRDRAFLEVRVQWTPTHPILATADNAEGPLTRTLELVDEWIWAEGEWWMAQQHRLSDVRKSHPELWVRDEER